MIIKALKVFALLAVGSLLGVGCQDPFVVDNNTTVTDTFESGSIGLVVKQSDTEWELSVANDNDDASLPASWRCWWSIKMDNVVRGEPTRITVKNSGWPYYYIPIYSYDQVEWRHFSTSEVSQNEAGELIITKQFEQVTVWMARFYPYTFTQLEQYIDSKEGSPYMDVQIPGYSRNGKPLYLFKLTDPSTPVSGKKRVFMHARTHSAETPSSFFIEGMVDFLLSGSLEAGKLLTDFEFYIFPMQNVDGVMAGNYRSTPLSENLEMLWCSDSINPLQLQTGMPPEVTVIHQYAVNLMSDSGPAVSMALNLHASNSEPDVCPFFYPHFGTQAQGYTATQASLWHKQLRFIDFVATHYGTDRIEPIPNEGGGSFATKTYPESWWWINFKDSVMAMTLEMTYGRAGYAPAWVEPNDLRNFGASVLRGIRDYYQADQTAPMPALRAAESSRMTRLTYPALYPPLAEDEMKE